MHRLQKQNSNTCTLSFIDNLDTSIYNSEFQFQPQKSDPVFNNGSNKVNKYNRGIGVNNVYSNLFEDSFQLIQPVTHIVFKEDKLYQRKKYTSDGIDQQIGVPFHDIPCNPISNNSEAKQISLLQSSLNTRKKSQQSQPIPQQPGLSMTKTAVKLSIGNNNPQIMQLQTKSKENPIYKSKKSSRIQKIVDMNLKNVQTSQSLIKQSRKINNAKRNSINIMVDKQQIMPTLPITKKNFKISSVISKLSESRRATKQQILEDSKKMFEAKISMNLNNQVMVKTKPDQISKNIESVPNQQMINLQTKQSQLAKTIKIDLKTPISLIKRVLIQTQSHLSTTFQIPHILLTIPNKSSTLAQLKQRLSILCKQASIQMQIASIRKYDDRIQIKNKKMCIIWGFDGHGYFGQWQPNVQTDAKIMMHGLGFMWQQNKYNRQTTHQQLNNQKNNTILNIHMYYGEFKNNKKEGYGIANTHQDQVYIGCWQNSLRHGWGKMFAFDGKIKENGQYKEDKLAQNL